MTENDREAIEKNLNQVRRHILDAARRSGRDPARIRLIAVTKNMSFEAVSAVVRLGVMDLGENRVQEMLGKQAIQGVDWHLIGHLQTNKVKTVIGRVKLIHSLDSWRLAEEINRRSVEVDIVTDALLQVNVSGEFSKYGLAPVEVADFLKAVGGLPGLKVRGLMTIAPLVRDSGEARPVFRELRLLSERLKGAFPGVSLEILSMGMTGDYQVAIEEGANMIRVGTAIFGSRY